MCGERSVVIKWIHGVACEFDVRVMTMTCTQLRQTEKEIYSDILLSAKLGSISYLCSMTKLQGVAKCRRNTISDSTCLLRQEEQVQKNNTVHSILRKDSFHPNPKI